jgi:tetratricopeptide (TPR) repeat protein
VAVWSGELAQYGDVPPEAEPTRPRVTNIPVQKDASSSKRVEHLSETEARPPAAQAARLGIAAILVLLLGMAARPTASALLRRAHLVPAAQREGEAPRGGAAAEAAALARPGVRIARFDNLTGDPSLDAVAQGAADAVRAELRTVPQIRIVEASSGEDPASGAAKASVSWILQGTVLRLGTQLRLTAHIEDASGASVGLPIELSGDSDQIAGLLASLQKRAVEEIKLLWHEEARRAWAAHATHGTAARSKLLEYYALIGLAPRDEHIEPGTQLLDQALASSPDYVPALVERSYLRAMEAAVRGRPERFASALADAERAVSLAPEDARALVMHCRIRQVALMASSPITDAGIERAISACNDAMRADPLSAYVPLVLARLYDLRCEDDRAMASLERALELDSSISDRILQHLVLLALQNSRLALAERMSRRLVEFQEEEARLGSRAFSRRMGAPLSQDAYLRRGAVLLRLGQLEEAKVALERELQVISDQIGTKGDEAAAIRGLLRIAREQGREAPPDLERRLSALEADYLSAAASNPGVLMTLAGKYQFTEPSAAVAWLERLGAPTSFRDTLGRAVFYNAAGDSEAARRALDACRPVERWEQACVDWMRSRLAH